MVFKDRIDSVEHTHLVTCLLTNLDRELTVDKTLLARHLKLELKFRKDTVWKWLDYYVV